jgi:hypothetical protein
MKTLDIDKFIIALEMDKAEACDKAIRETNPYSKSAEAGRAMALADVITALKAASK